MLITTPDVQVNCEDLKVLGKGDFKALMKWRLALREEVGIINYASLNCPVDQNHDLQLGLDSKTPEDDDSTENVEVVEVLDEDAEISKEVASIEVLAKSPLTSVHSCRG